jgi:translation initiation factor IF-3
MPQNKVTNV